MTLSPVSEEESLIHVAGRSGGGGETRTRKPVKAADFESAGLPIILPLRWGRKRDPQALPKVIVFVKSRAKLD